MNALAIAVVLGSAACGFHPSPATTGDDDGSNDGGVVDAQIDATVNAGGPCGTAGAIRDDFDDNTVGSQWAVLDTTTTETGGEMVTSPIAGQFIGFGGYTSRHMIDLSAGGSIDVEVTSVLDTNKAFTEFLLYIDGKNYVGIIETNQTLYVQTAINGAGSPEPSIAYDPNAQKWWRLTENADGSVTAFVSADDATWIQLGTPVVNAAAPSWIAQARIIMAGLNTDMAATHGEAKFDNLDQDVTAASWCKTDTFVDKFDRPMIGTAWTASRPPMGAPTCTPTVNNGASFDQTGAQNNSCYLAGEAGLDLTNAHISAHVPAVTNPKPGWTGALRYDTDDGNVIAIQIDLTNHLCTVAGMAATEVCTATYDPAQTYWRIGAANGTVTFETSSDNASWVTFGTATVAFPVSAGELVIGSIVSTPFSMPPIDFEVAAINAP